VAPPLKWNTLEEASMWLSEKTKEKWTPERIINFSIDQCRPDNIIEDYKYPSYLQTILPESTSDYLTFVSLRLDDSPLAYVREGIRLREREIKTTFVFRDNLIELASLGKTAIHYVSYNDQLHTDSVPKEKEKPIIVYCELRLLILDLEKPYPKFPSIPIIHINFETIGIHDEELKQLLRDYLALPKQAPVTRNTKLNDKPVVSGIGNDNNNRIKLFIGHYKSTKGLKRDDFFKPILTAVEEVNCFDSDDVFSKLMEFARSGKYQLDSENSYEYYDFG